MRGEDLASRLRSVRRSAPKALARRVSYAGPDVALCWARIADMKSVSAISSTAHQTLEHAGRRRGEDDEASFVHPREQALCDVLR